MFYYAVIPLLTGYFNEFVSAFFYKVFYNHEEGILLSNVSLLGDDIKVTSTSISSDGKTEFVASYEFKDYPFFAV
jgi:hypothetical protein